MKNLSLKIGKIPYANLFPIFYMLEKNCDCSQYEFVEGVPSMLNKMLRNGKIDVSPSSSIEYLRHKAKYSLIEGFSISSKGPAGSIFLFSKSPIKTLDKKTIAVSPHSETSVVLLKIIMKDFLSMRCKLKTVNGNLNNILSSFPACLLIGDEAMKTKKTALQTLNSGLYIYDLGELWFKQTGLPFVFALWIARKKSLSEKRGLIEKFSSDLIKATAVAVKEFPLAARAAPQRQWLSEEELLKYWKGISYDFTDEHKKGLELFFKYAQKHEEI
ncbi:MAG: menaquinone biosynthesis protein [Nitrospirae bacterium]|nr:menaquinone biosynthesis protein [Nitrospirota bacterium]